jgi:L-seryl-tRNA(Ser) seleniumtransferase
LAADLSSLPSVDRLLNTAILRLAQETHGRECVTAAVRAHVATLRKAAREGVEAKPDLPDIEAIAKTISASVEKRARPSLRKVVNLTGTVLHTNLGRAVLPDAAVTALAEAARYPCNLEFDLDEGRRGERDGHVESTIGMLTGAEAALVVNNNAAAVFLVLNTLAQRREVVVSRGELVEIGGQFRIPDIMTRSGAILREVGATNRTHLHDYASAIGPRTALLLKVHTSNYEVRGFTSSVTTAELAATARTHAIPLAVDLGSGTLLDMRQWGLPYEPTARAALDDGADIVMFSGDKLLGGPQCGIVAGRKDLVERLRRNPLKRALRVDKLVLSALEQVLRLYLNPACLSSTLPTLRMLVRSLGEIELVARRLADALAPHLPQQYAVEVVPCMSQIGSGALPVDLLPSAGVRIHAAGGRRQRERDIQRLQKVLRGLAVPILGRIDDHDLLLDCRCLLEPEAVLADIAAHAYRLGAAGPDGAAEAEAIP